MKHNEAENKQHLFNTYYYYFILSFLSYQYLQMLPSQVEVSVFGIHVRITLYYNTDTLYTTRYTIYY